MAGTLFSDKGGPPGAVPRGDGRSIEFSEVPAPCYAESALVPLRPAAERAVRDVSGALTSLLLISDHELRGAEAEFRDYYVSVLQPKALAPWMAVSDDEVLEVDFERDDRPEIIVLGTWRDTFYEHGLRFVAALEPGWGWGQPYRVANFQRLDMLIDGYAVLDLDGSGDPEVVLRLHDGPHCAARVVSLRNRAWSAHTLPSNPSIELVQEEARYVFVAHGPAGQHRFTWTHVGFQPIQDGRE